MGKCNSTLISLIPKIQTPDKVTDFRPIACCNVIYKCISKVITNRLKTSLGDLVGLNQSAFVPNRHIQDNILLSQELLKGYERKYGPKRIAMKVDIQKAYDIIMSCVTTASFSIYVNGERCGYFKGGRGLRQGDPMSPYLFTLVMEILSLIVHNKVDKSEDFKYHFGCRKIKLTHVCFADDLLMFCNGDKNSANVLKEAIEEFGLVSGLIPNYNKSTIIFGSMTEEERNEILGCVPFKVENLPIKYLGMPLTSKRIGVNNCKSLIDKIRNIHILTYKDMYNARMKPKIVVKDILCNGKYNWPRQWLDKYPELSLCHDIRLDNNKEDELVWKSRKGKEGKYTIRQAYNDLRMDYDEDLVMGKIGIQFPKMEWNDLVNMMAGLYNGNAIASIIRRLGFAASVYLIWQERNNRIFKDEKRSPKELAESLYDTIRMRLMSLKVKMSKAVLEAQERWNVNWQSG
ncbi:RNA-directed DNA polymerase, eukaryota, reverse transcriptase zinc-binding domain protein [Tanacetum coccineum]